MTKKNHIVCKICKKECVNFFGLSLHISKKHNKSSKEYYDKYLKTEDEGICLGCGVITNFVNLNIGYRKYCSYLYTWCGKKINHLQWLM